MTVVLGQRSVAAEQLLSLLIFQAEGRHDYTQPVMISFNVSIIWLIAYVADMFDMSNCILLSVLIRRLVCAVAFVYVTNYPSQSCQVECYEREDD
jgi:hypothetical protein